MPSLLILGATARSAAASARRAGLDPIGLDLFADRDLAAMGTARAVDPGRYPEGLLDLAAEAPAVVPWIYTGAMENRPDLIARLAAVRPLRGNPAEVVRAVRDPLRLADCLRRAGQPAPRVGLDPRSLPRDGSFLIKPLASAAGRKIAPWTADTPELSEPAYYQERIEGPSLGATFLGRGEAELIGLTRHLVGAPGRPFAYRGVIGPEPVGPGLRREVEAIGRAVVDAFGLVGLFGVDLIVRDGRPWALEVNPRPSASVEVLELATGRSLLAGHVEACGGEAGQGHPSRTERPAAVGKMVVYATAPGRAPAWPGWRAEADPWAVPRFADVPQPGVPFEVGEPVISLLEGGPDAASVRDRLAARLRRWERWARRAAPEVAAR